MSETKNLRLFKHNEPLETNENKFDIDLALNQNWDKIEEFAGMVNDKVIELEDKDEEQDFNLQELQNEIKKDRENMINLEVEGQSIHIEDSSDLEGKLEVLGNVEQKTVKGIQLLEGTNEGTTGWLFATNPSNKGTIKEVDYLGTKAVEFSVSEEINSWKYIKRQFKDYSKLKKNTKYTILLDVKTNYDESAFSISLKNNIGTNVFLEFPIASINNTSRRLKLVGTSNDLELTDQFLYISAGHIGVPGRKLIITNLIMVEGDYSNKDLEWEEYTNLEGMPSINYPSEIRAVGDNINLWDKENMLVELGGYSGSNGNKYDSTTRIRNTKDIELKKDTYTLSAENSKLISIYIVDLKKELSSNGDSVTFTLEKDNTIRFTIENTALLNTEIKLERGNKKTGYSPYGQGSVEIKKTTANYYNVEDYNGNLNSHITIDENNWITASGKNTEESVTYLNHFTNNLDLIVGKKYWIVAEIKSVSGEGNFNITSASKGSGQFNGRAMQLTDLKIGQKVIFQETAINSAGQGLRTFISLQPGQTCNITFRLSVLETEPNKSNWKYVPYKKETKTLPIQKPMLEGDYFVKEVDGWKEVHKWKKIILNGQENTWQLYETGTRRFGLDLTKDLPLKETGKYAQGYCTHFEVATTMNINLTMFLQVEIGHFYIGIVDKNSKWADVNALKSELQRLYNAGTPVILYYKLDVPTKLNCTPEQTKVLDELDNFQTYKPVTNITTDSIAKLKLKYIADTKAYIDNKTSNLEQQVNTINQLLSTTKTSAKLLDNLQSDIESEVL